MSSLLDLPPHRYPKCFESVMLVQTSDKQDMSKGKAKGHCVFAGGRRRLKFIQY